jgi:Uma2 family endonuclease
VRAGSLRSLLATRARVRSTGEQSTTQWPSAIFSEMSTHPTEAMLRERMTLEQWASLDEDVQGELVDGALVEEEVPDTIHELMVTWLIITLGNWGRSLGVLVLGSGTKLAVSSDRGRIPDVVAFFPEARTPPLRGVIHAPPSLVVEVVSATAQDARRDRVEKLGEYAAFGVRWYWIVDPELRSFEILELGSDGRYAHAVAVTGGTMQRVPGCEGLSLDIDALWEEIDALARRAEGERG